MYTRYLLPKLIAALKDTPVVLLSGARQSGKSTLVQTLSPQHKTHYITLDKLSTLDAAHTDPEGFIAGLAKPVILDEIQRAPALFLAIKSAVDEQRVPGNFLLTGSANVLLLPRLADSLAGRMEILTLWPLAMQERMNTSENFIDAIFQPQSKFTKPATLTEQTVADYICTGGYPEAIMREEDRRQAWFNSYLTTILQRDIKNLANIEGLHDLSRLLKLLAARNTTLLNYAELSRSVGIAQTTLKRYMTLLEMTFLIFMIPPWHRNTSKRIVKSVKLLLTDTGIAAHLLGMSAKRLLKDRTHLGHLLENFVIVELQKQSTWSQSIITLQHFRTQNGEEVDLVLEKNSGELVGIEIKASHTVSAKDFIGLKILAELSGAQFIKGIVFYLGEDIIPFGENLFAMPLALLWMTNLKNKTK